MARAPSGVTLARWVRCRGAPDARGTPGSDGCGGAGRRGGTGGSRRRLSARTCWPGRAATHRGHRALLASPDVRAAAALPVAGERGFPRSRRSRNVPRATGEQTARAATSRRSTPLPGSLRFEAFSLAARFGFGKAVVGVFLIFFFLSFGFGWGGGVLPPSKCGLFFLAVKGKK